MTFLRFTRRIAHPFVTIILILLMALVDARAAIAEPRKLCAAIRGNGARIFVHFSSLAFMNFMAFYGASLVVVQVALYPSSSIAFMRIHS